MVTAVDFTQGGYRYVPGVSQYSGGVAALAGHAIVRARFHRPVPLSAGFERIAGVIQAAGRPLTAFCACELRSPAPFTEDGFKTFNAAYCGVLERWGIFRDGRNPVARSNVCPEIDPPAEPSFHAFCYTVEAADAVPSFAIAGSGEAPEGKANYRDHIVRLNDTSPEGLREKARFVLAEMERRMAVLGFGWPDTTAAQVYTVFDLYPFLAEEIVARGAAAHGLTWHLCRPPVVGLDYEMDCRGLASETVV
jgi:hypothetical protein